MTNVPLYRLSATWFLVAHCACFFFILSTTLILKIKQYMFTRYMNIDWHLNRTNLYLLAISSLRRISRQNGTLPNFEVRVARRGNLKNHSKL